MPQRLIEGVQARRRCQLLPLVFAVHVALSQLGAAAQLLGASDSNNTLILTSKGLALAIKNPVISRVVIQGKQSARPQQKDALRYLDLQAMT